MDTLTNFQMLLNVMLFLCYESFDQQSVLDRAPLNGAIKKIAGSGEGWWGMNGRWAGTRIIPPPELCG